MPAQASTKLQVNFSLPDRTLINVYADDENDLNVQLTAIGNQAEVIAATSRALSGSTPAQAVQAVQQGLGGTVISQTSAPASMSLPENHCQHGALVFREGNGPKGAWKGWFCPTPKGTPGQCAPKFIR